MRMLACYFSYGMLSVVVMAECEGDKPLLELVMLFVILYKCLVVMKWSSVHRKEFQFCGFFSLLFCC